jgi:hypothetical protein
MEQNKAAADVERATENAPNEATQAAQASTPIEDHAAHIAHAATPPAYGDEPNPLVKSLPLLFSLAALLLASYAFFIAQQGGYDQQAQIQSLAMRMGSLEGQTTVLQSQMDKIGNTTENQRVVMIHNELSTIASSLQKIAPLAQGEQQTLIQNMQQLLDGKPSSETTE